MNKFYSLFIFTLITCSTAFSQDLSDRLLFTARLSGDNNTTVVNGNAIGIANLILNSNRDTLFVNAAVANIGKAVAEMRIQEGQAGQDGNTILAFDSVIVNNKLNVVITDTNLSNILPSLLSEELYFNVYDSLLPANGTCRGQIKLESDFGFFANLDTAQSVPVTNGIGVASANFKLDQNGDSLTVKLVASGLSGAITSIHLHRGDSGVNGPVIVDLTSLVKGNRIDSIIAVPAEIKADLKNLVESGLVYVNLHTNLYPSGEIRGQVKSSKDLYFDLFASEEQLTAPQTFASDVAAAGHAYLNNTFDTLRYFFVYEVDSLTSNPVLTSFTTNGAPTKNLTPENGVISGFWTATDATPLSVLSITAFLTDQAGFSMNTTFNPGGELAGSFTRTFRDAFVFDLDTTQVVDTIEVSKRPLGAGMISVNTRGTNAHYMMAWDSLSSAATGATLNLGVAGENGIILADLSPVTGGAFGYLTSTVGFNTAFTARLQSDSIYVNVSTENNPTGEIRGNVGRNYNTVETPTAIYENGNNFENFVSYPNPANEVLNLRFTAATTGKASVEIISLEGRIVSSTAIQLNKDNNISLNINNLEQGLYVVRVNAANAAIANSFIKN